MHILVTGFEPFGGHKVNASWEAVRRLPSFVSGHEITSFQLPVDFERAAELALLRAEILEADAVLCVGMAAGREKICLEARAVNRMETAVPDNAGFCPRGEAIEEDGPSERLSSMPVSAMALALTEAGIPAVVSEDAGTFVCNDLFYRLLSEYEGSRISVGFIHVPSAKTLETSLVTRALEICLACL